MVSPSNVTMLGPQMEVAASSFVLVGCLTPQVLIKPAEGEPLYRRFFYYTAGRWMQATAYDYWLSGYTCHQAKGRSQGCLITIFILFYGYHGRSR